MHRSKRIPTWLTYLTLIVAAHVAHACALESDKSAPHASPVAVRHT